MSFWQTYRADIVFTFRKHKAMAEKALHQLDGDLFFQKPGEHSNSVAVIVKHIGGNLASRWTDFLTTDGDKLSRDRDAEFVIGPADTREHLLKIWDNGWAVLLQTLESLDESDALTTVRIRGEEHSVLQAIHRSLGHTAYHVGQVTYLARLLKSDGWNWITIPPGKSAEWNAKGGRYLKA